MADAKAIARKLYASLKGTPSSTSKEDAKSTIDAILRDNGASIAVDGPQIKVELRALLQNDAATATATTTGACYYNSGGTVVCDATLTQAQCAHEGGTFVPGEPCMLGVAQALYEEGLLP